MTISKWLKMDLHIHSWESNKKKPNDYEGDPYDVNMLIDKLTKNNINLFSITDHNSINVNLYECLLLNRDKLLEKNLNFIVGTELDILDKKIYGNKVFHTLLFFDSYDIEKINKILYSLTIENCQNVKPSLDKIFEVMSEYNERNFILIPHFNNKSKGLKDKFMKKNSIDCLNTMIFDAYEDSNNINKIQESLDIYSKNGYDDLPMLIFSDCHNLEVYPKYKEESNKNPEFLSILGNLKYPFESLKLAFQDSTLRIGFDDISKNKMYRLSNIDKSKKTYIDKIKINDDIIKFSEYQNTIIGGFGSGKSFLINLIRHGKQKLLIFEKEEKKYRTLLDGIHEFEIFMSDGSSRNSLTEIGDNCELIVFEQHEGLFYKNRIDEVEKNKLEEQLKINFPKLEPINEINFDNLYSYVEEYKKLNDTQVTDNFNYSSLKEREFYRVNITLNNTINFEKNTRYDDIVNLLNEEMHMTIFNKNIYTSEDIQIINKAKNIIIKKNKLWNSNLNKYNVFKDEIETLIKYYNRNQDEDTNSILSNTEIYENINKHLYLVGNNLKKLKSECDILEKKLSVDSFNDHLNEKSEYRYGDFLLVTKYANNTKYTSYKNNVLKADFREQNLFNGIIMSIKEKEGFQRNKTFSENTKKYYNDIFYNNFSKFNYDIKKNGESIMHKSAGEKSNMILELIFCIIDNSVEDEKNVILLIDQPEDHLDNRNIDKNIVNKIIQMKKNNSLPQFIFVTHNANVAITADSENIIIANKKGDECHYKNGGIENKEFIGDVCNILEGGPDALKRRGMKFSVSYIKEYIKEDDLKYGCND